jgi:hypothetical protein
MKMEQTECSETSAYKIQTLGNYPEEHIQYSEHDDSLKSRIIHHVCLSVQPSVRPSTWNNSARTGRIFIKFDIQLFFETLSRKFKFH